MSICIRIYTCVVIVPRDARELSVHCRRLGVNWINSQISYLFGSSYASLIIISFIVITVTKRAHILYGVVYRPVLSFSVSHFTIAEQPMQILFIVLHCVLDVGRSKDRRVFVTCTRCALVSQVIFCMVKGPASDSVTAFLTLNQFQNTNR